MRRAGLCDGACAAQNYAGLASIHSAAEQSQANSACAALAPANSVAGTPHGCWIGYHDRPQPGQTGVWTSTLSWDRLS